MSNRLEILDEYFICRIYLLCYISLFIKRLENQQNDKNADYTMPSLSSSSAAANTTTTLVESLHEDFINSAITKTIQTILQSKSVSTTSLRALQSIWRYFYCLLANLYI